MIRAIRGVAAVCLATAISACSQTGNIFSDGLFSSAISTHEVTIRHDHGGSVAEYAKKRERYLDDNRLVRFAGDCASACTMFLGLPSDQTCIMPGATFSFHRPYGGSPEQNQQVLFYMIYTYPQWVRDWIEAEGGLTTTLKVMSNTYASQFIQSCDDMEI